MVPVARPIAGVATIDLAGAAGEGVPDRGSPPVLIHGPVDLVRGRRRPPQGVLWKVHLDSPCLYATRPANHREALLRARLRTTGTGRATCPRTALRRPVGSPSPTIEAGFGLHG